VRQRKKDRVHVTMSLVFNAADAAAAGSQTQTRPRDYTAL